jgi:hypothetical protein
VQTTPPRRPAAPAARTVGRAAPRTPGAPPRPAPPVRRPAGSAPPGRTDTRGPAVRPRERPRALPPHLWFAQALLDVLTGRRPLTALAGRVRGEAYQRLWQLHAERCDWRDRAHGRTPYVRRCRAVATCGGALEVAAVVALDEGVVRAIAFRLEPGDAHTAGYGQRRWHCTDVAAR